MLQTLLDCLFPRRSLQGREGMWMTQEERAQLRVHQPVLEEEAALRAQEIVHLDRLFAACSYQDVPLLRAAVWRFKYRGIRTLGDELAAVLLERAPVLDAASPVLCPVPLHWTRLFQRGFNQAEWIARIVGAGRNIPVCPLLRRIRATGHQARRDRAARRRAVGQWAFRALGSVPAHVILIDDIATTGATLDACAAVLKAAGAVRVEAWVVARG